MLPPPAERLAAGHKELEPDPAAHAAGSPARHRVLFAWTERIRDSRGNQARIPNRRPVDEPYAVRKGIAARFSDGDCQSGLAWSGQCEQPHGGIQEFGAPVLDV